MAKKKKPVPGSKKKPQPKNRETTQPTGKKKPQPTGKKMPKSAGKKKPQPAEKKNRPIRNKKMHKRAEPSVPKARADSKTIARFALIILLVLAVAGSIVLAIFSFHEEMMPKKIRIQYSGVLQSECLFPISFEDEQVQNLVQATKRRGQKRAFTYFCNDTLKISPYSLSGPIFFGNPADNDCTLVLTILDEDDRQIYRSDGVEPGYYITQISPYVELADGDHACTAYVTAYASQEQGYKCVGAQYSRLTVQMGETS